MGLAQEGCCLAANMRVRDEMLAPIAIPRDCLRCWDAQHARLPILVTGGKEATWLRLHALTALLRSALFASIGLRHWTMRPLDHALFGERLNF